MAANSDTRNPSLRRDPMTVAEARHFLHTCNDEIEAGMTPDLARRIREARVIVAGAMPEFPALPAPSGESLEAEFARLFADARAAAPRAPMPPPLDPIHAAIAAHRAAFAWFLETIDRVDVPKPDQAAVDANRNALDAECAALDAFVATVPTTLAGARAMLAYAIEVDKNSLPAIGGKIAATLLRSSALAA